MALHDMLTRREWEVYELLFQGKSFLEIGAKLSISKGTTDQHVRHILAKLGLNSRSQAQYYAVTHGLFREIVEMHVAREERDSYTTDHKQNGGNHANRPKTSGPDRGHNAGKS